MAWGWRVHSLYRLYAFSNLQELKLQILRVQIMMFLQQEPLYKIMEPRRCRRNSVVKEWEPFAKFVISHLRNSCFWHEKDNVGHRTLLANFDHEQVRCVSGSQQTSASWSFFSNSFWDSVKSKCFPVGSAAIFLRFLHAFVFCIISLAMFFSFWMCLHFV